MNNNIARYNNVDIRLPKSFFVTKKSGSNSAGLITSPAETRSMIEWTESSMKESVFNFIGGSYANNAAAVAASLPVGTIYYNTTTGYLTAVTA